MHFPFLAWMASCAGSLLLAAAIIGCVYLTAASWLVLNLDRTQRRTRGAKHAPVTVLKPLHGDEPDLLARLSALCRQNYAGPVQLVFGTQDRCDPSIAVVQRLQADFPEARIELHVDPSGHGSNPKISNLANMAIHARHPLLVMADSDIEVGADYLTDVVDELQEPGVGAVSCLYHGVARGGLWAQLSALAVQTHFLPNVVVAASLGLAKPCFGATIAMRRETLARIGGLASFAHCLADDYMIGEAVRAEAGDVVFPPFSVGHVCAQTSASELVVDELRQVRTIRTIDPFGYAGSVITHPLPLALFAWLCGSVSAPYVVVLAVVLRVGLCRCIERSFGLGRQPYALLPLRDLISFAIFVSSFFGATVSWRGHRYHALSDGTLVQDPGRARS